MAYFSILLFFAYTFCLGFAITSFVKNSENFLERNLMRIGIGLSLLPFLGLVLNLFRIPIDWRLMLALSVAYPVYYIARYNPFQKLSFKITKTDLSILLMLVLFFINLYTYASGAFAYPYLEDDDSWSHAIGLKYVSTEKKVFSESRIFHYMDPYPPSYDLLMGLLHQTNDSVYFTLKFFNALIISMSTIFFYFFVKELTGSRNKSLFAAFALASIPAFMSHFIWALSLTVPLYFVSFYALERLKHDNKWWAVAGLSMVTVFTSSPTHSTYFGLFLVLYLAAKMMLEKKILWHHSIASLLGVLLSSIVWWIPMLVKHGFKGTLEGMGFSIGILTNVGAAAAFRGTGDRVYTFSDFFFAQKENMVNNPIGIGVFLSVLTIAGIFFLFLHFKENIKEENRWIIIVFAWFVLAFYAVNAAKFPIKLSPFRVWMLLAIPVCILAAHGAFSLMSMAKQSIGNISKYSILLVLIIGVYFTSAQQKIAVNTSPGWPPGGFWTSGDEIGAYVWLKQSLAKNTPVFTFVNDGTIIGMDMYTCYWCDDVRAYKKTGFNQTAQETHEWLRSKGYNYFIMDGQTVQKFGVDESNQKIKELAESGLFQVAFQNRGAVVFRV